MRVISEFGNEELVNSRIAPAIKYCRQKDTIVTWYDVDKEQELALSFQCIDDTMKMLYLNLLPFREIILNIQGKDPLECIEENESIEEEELPPPGLNNLSCIGEEFSSMSLCFPRKRMKLTHHCLKDGVTFLYNHSATT